MKQLMYALCIMAIFASCNMPANNTANDQATKNKALVQKFYDDVFNKHNPDAIDSLLAPDYIEHTTMPGYENTRAGLKKSFADFFTGFPDVHVTTNFVVADSNTVWVQMTTTGTNTGPMMGMPATNKKINVDGVDIVKFKDGKAVEHWSYMEEGKMMTQLGLAPDMTKMDSTKTVIKDDKGGTTTTTTVTKEVKKEMTKETKK